jgi:DNA-binding XRE family transcriptional regulator
LDRFRTSVQRIACAKNINVRDHSLSSLEENRLLVTLAICGRMAQSLYAFLRTLIVCEIDEDDPSVISVTAMFRVGVFRPFPFVANVMPRKKF